MSKGVINGEQGQQYLDEFENQWILCYKNVIVDAAEMYDIPPYMLAGVLKIELGGDPLWIDDPAYILRKFVYGQKRADQTSFGNISMQVGTAADTLDYNYQFLTNYSRDAIINSLKDNIQGIYIAAKHLSYLRNIDYKGMGAVDLTEEQVRNIATRYNLGPSKSLNEIENTSGYGQHVVNFRKTLEEILYGEE